VGRSNGRGDDTEPPNDPISRLVGTGVPFFLGEYRSPVHRLVPQGHVRMIAYPMQLQSVGKQLRRQQPNTTRP